MIDLIPQIAYINLFACARLVMQSNQLHSRAASASGDSSGLVSSTASKQALSPVLHFRKPMATYGVGFPPVAIAVHVLGLLTFALIITWVTVFREGFSLFSSNANKIFNAHPVILFGGFIFIYSEAILVYKTLGGAKKSKKLVHLSLQAIAFLLALLGVYAAYKNHVLAKADNWYSLHSWLGIATLSLFFIQWVAGFVSFWTQSVGPSTRAAVLPWHVFLGLAIYVLAITTATTGLLEKITFLNINVGVGHYASETQFVNSVAFVLLLFGAVTVFAATLPAKEDDGYQAIN